MSPWPRRYEDGWAHDLDALRDLIRPQTRLLYLNQPHNPTGTLLTRSAFDQVIGLAWAHEIVVFSDEVYRELEHDPAGRLPAACDVYERAAWIRPTAGPIGFPRVNHAGDLTQFCAQLAEQAGVLLLPGAVYDQPDHIRVGFGRANMPDALQVLEASMAASAEPQ